MKSAPLLMALLLLATSMFSQKSEISAEISATSSSISTKQCRRSPTAYEIEIEGTFEIENASRRVLSIAKKIEAVRTVMAASSPSNAKHGKYSFVMNQEIGVDTTAPKPGAEDFITLKPHEKGQVRMGVVLPVSTQESRNDNEQLGPGKHWIQFEFLPVPLSFPRDQKSYRAWKKESKVKGNPLKRYIVTEPFLVDISLDKAIGCDSN